MQWPCQKQLASEMILIKSCWRAERLADMEAYISFAAPESYPSSRHARSQRTSGTCSSETKGILIILTVSGWHEMKKMKKGISTSSVDLMGCSICLICQKDEICLQYKCIYSGSSTAIKWKRSIRCSCDSDEGSHLAVSVIHTQRHVGRCQKQQGFLFWKLLFQPLDDLWPLVGSLKEKNKIITSYY